MTFNLTGLIEPATQNLSEEEPKGAQSPPYHEELDGKNIGSNLLMHFSEHTS